jgi:peptidyl-prolyl cis-trans isomerase B (cyclophilin B)
MIRALLIATLITGFIMSADANAQQSDAPKPKSPPQGNTPTDTFQITVRQGNTELGTIEFVLWPGVAPKHVEFVAKRIAEGWYNGSAFHRVIPGFMIQGGDPNSKSQPRETWGGGGFPEKVVAEFNDRKHERGVMSAARTQDPNSFSGQFFICVADAPWLDGQYTAFGKVTKGMEVVDQIVASPRDSRDNPIEKIEMTVVKKGS